MKRIKEHSPVQDLQKAAERFEKIGGQQITGRVRIRHAGQEAINKYVLEDGSEVMEDDKGNPVTKWPELPPHVIAKRAEKAAQ